MTPEDMHAAATRLRCSADPTDHDGDGIVLAARLLDRLAANPLRDPVEAYNSPPERWNAICDATRADDGTITAEVVAVEKLDAPSRGGGHDFR